MMTTAGGARVGAVALSLGALVAGGGVLAACGSGGGSSNGLATKSAHQIFSATVSQLSKASSTRISGDVAEGSRKLNLDLSLLKDGESTGTFGFKGAMAKVVVADQHIYFYGSATFWTDLESAAGSTSSSSSSEYAKLANIWISLPSSSASGFATFQYAGLVSSLKNGAGTLSKVGTRTIEGQPTVGVKGTKQGTLWVSTTGAAYPVALTNSTNGETQQVNFSDWNAKVTVTVPKNSKSVEQVLEAG